MNREQRIGGAEIGITDFGFGCAHANPRLCRCSFQSRGNRVSSMSFCAVSSGGCFPPRIALTMSGASSVRRNPHPAGHGKRLAGGARKLRAIGRARAFEAIERTRLLLRHRIRQLFSPTRVDATLAKPDRSAGITPVIAFCAIVRSQPSADAILRSRPALGTA
jgi:hypothetical protein